MTHFYESYNIRFAPTSQNCTNISKLSPTLSVSNIRHQHRCSLKSHMTSYWRHSKALIAKHSKLFLRWKIQCRLSNGTVMIASDSISMNQKSVIPFSMRTIYPGGYGMHPMKIRIFQERFMTSVSAIQFHSYFFQKSEFCDFSQRCWL